MMINFEKNTRIIYGAFLGLVTLALSACTGMNSEFTCPMQPGQMCTNVDEVNKMINQGKIGKNVKTTDTADAQDDLEKMSSLQPGTLTGYPATTMQPGEPLRYGESVMRVWIAPYEGVDGNYYQASTLYAVVKPGHWIGNPVKAVNEDD